jgi:hypothetical protein
MKRRVEMRRFFRHPLVVTSVTIIIGATAGWLVFLVSDLTGWRLFLLRGALVGVITGLAMVIYLRRAETFILSEVTLTVPEFAELKFAVNTEYRRVAWKLFIETLTRVATQPLGTEDGSLREALTSLYGLFGVTRDLLKNMQPSKPTTNVTVEMLAVKMLNREIRPFLSKWHVQLKKFESMDRGVAESDWSENNNCRKELEALRKRLISYTKAFGELGGVTNPAMFFEP